jgi:hypothetical protein
MGVFGEGGEFVRSGRAQRSVITLGEENEFTRETGKSPHKPSGIAAMLAVAGGGFASSVRGEGILPSVCAHDEVSQGILRRVYRRNVFLASIQRYRGQKFGGNGNTAWAQTHASRVVHLISQPLDGSSDLKVSSGPKASAMVLIVCVYNKLTSQHVTETRFRLLSDLPSRHARPDRLGFPVDRQQDHGRGIGSACALCLGRMSRAHSYHRR